MTISSRIYMITHRNGPPRLVEAHHPANALRHVAADEFRVEVASQQDLVDLVSAGTKVERIRAPTPATDAGDLFSAEHGGPDDADSEGGDPDVRADEDAEVGETVLAEPERGEAWPFPRDGEHADEAPPQAVTTEPSRRTARGRAATRAALETGSAS